MAGVWATPADPFADLRDFMDQQYGEGLWTYRSGHGVGSDCADAFEAALDAAKARYGYGGVRVVGNGIFRSTRPIDPAKLNGQIVQGIHPNSSQICFEMEAGYGFHWDGGVAEGIARSCGGPTNLEVFIDSVVPGSTPSFFLMEGNAIYQPSALNFDRVFTDLLGTQPAYNGFIVNATARTSPQGSRNSSAKAVYIFGCRNIGMQFANAVLWSCDQLNTSNCFGTGGDVYFTGGGTGVTNTTGCKFSRSYFNGDLRVNNLFDVEFTGRADRIIAAPTAVGLYGWAPTTPLFGTLGAHCDLKTLD